MSVRDNIKGFFTGLVVVLLSIFGGLVFGELFLRTFLPDRYLNAVAATNVADETKIWAPPKNVTNYFRHPDTKQRITLRRNNVGIRSERDVIETDLQSTINIAVFGDSFTDNIRIHESHVFTNLLERLLNAKGEQFRVLNFGVDSYGTDQAFVRYLEQPFRQEFDYVIYLFCFNDIRNNLATGISSVNEAGKITIVPKFPRIPSLLKRVTQMHMTYFFVEWYLRISSVVSDVFAAH